MPRLRLLVPLAALAPLASAFAAPPGAATSWRDDPAWYQGKAEWALYDAQRTIYGKPRRYEATVFTNKQRMDPASTTKTDEGGIEVFKHNVSEMVPTENYTYRFLTTCFIRTDTLAPFKIVASTQEDCGTTYRRFVADGGEVQATSFCYFPGAGPDEASFPLTPRLAFHDALTLTLRDYPFDEATHPAVPLELVVDQTSPRPTLLRPAPATLSYGGRETITVPYGEVDTHLLVVQSGAGGRSRYWFAADPALRHVLVRYEGPEGERYDLKRLAWWAYWAEPRPE